ncbi:unnamed protein product [marine sediment metagenome]|uniref:Uncharacterized protein n=1 Tax=marine sediment metagenome TaxID=412755 RepID=X1IV98_9ZZZZ
MGKDRRKQKKGSEMEGVFRRELDSGYGEGSENPQEGRRDAGENS